MPNQSIAPRCAASRARRLPWRAAALAAAALLAACAMPTHPDSAAPPSDPFNPAATQLLDNTSWVLTGGSADDGSSINVPQEVGQTPTLDFSTTTGQRRASGITGCNRFTANYELKNGALSFSSLNTTRLGCGGAVGKLEQTYVGALSHVAKTAVQMHVPQQLKIIADDGTTLTFARKDR
jgi:heat shock protein HslJ